MANKTNVSDEHAKEVCRPTSGSFGCSYLVLNSDGWECLKGSALEKVIQIRRAEKTINALGDNCSGPPDFIPTQEVIH